MSMTPKSSLKTLLISNGFHTVFMQFKSCGMTLYTQSCLTLEVCYVTTHACHHQPSEILLSGYFKGSSRTFQKLQPPKTGTETSCRLLWLQNLPQHTW